MPQSTTQSKALQEAIEVIRLKGGTVRTSYAIRSGIHPRTLYQLRDEGYLETVSRGVYRLSEQGEISNPDFAIVATRIPKAVVCLVSALSFHDITTQIPHAVSIALSKGSETPRLDYPPLKIHRFSEKPFVEGVEEHAIDGYIIKVYCPEKTISDCFKFRNKIGMDIVLEALKLYKARKRYNLDELLRYAKVCRVEKIMRPYLEATL